MSDTDVDVHQAYAEKVNFVRSEHYRRLERGVAPELRREVKVAIHLGDGGVPEPAADGLEVRAGDEELHGVAVT